MKITAIIDTDLTLAVEKTDPTSCQLDSSWAPAMMAPRDVDRTGKLSLPDSTIPVGSVQRSAIGGTSSHQAASRTAASSRAQLVARTESQEEVETIDHEKRDAKSPPPKAARVVVFNDTSNPQCGDSGRLHHIIEEEEDETADEDDEDHVACSDEIEIDITLLSGSSETNSSTLLQQRRELLIVDTVGAARARNKDDDYPTKPMTYAMAVGEVCDDDDDFLQFGCLGCGEEAFDDENANTFSVIRGPSGGTISVGAADGGARHCPATATARKMVPISVIGAADDDGAPAATATATTRKMVQISCNISVGVADGAQHCPATATARESAPSVNDEMTRLAEWDLLHTT